LNIWTQLLSCKSKRGYVAGDEYFVDAQRSADAADDAMRQQQPVSEVAMDVQVRLHVQMG